jgi:methionyl-tRNA synthetase
MDANNKPQITYPEFEKLDVRIGTITAASIPEWSKKLIRFEVDFGELGVRTIFSGIQAWYNASDFVGHQFPFLINLAPKPMGKEGDVSQGMMLMADGSEKPVLLEPQTNVASGSVVR